MVSFKVQNASLIHSPSTVQPWLGKIEDKLCTNIERQKRKQNNSVRKVSVAAEMQNGHAPNTNHNSYCLNNLARQ